MYTRAHDFTYYFIINSHMLRLIRKQKRPEMASQEQETITYLKIQTTCVLITLLLTPTCYV